MKATKGQMRSGFTLVELLVVISIIVVLAGLAVPTAMKGLAKAEEVKAISNVKGIKSALDLFATEFDGEYPSDDTAAQILELSSDDVGGGGGGRALRGSSLDRPTNLGSSNGVGGRGGNNSAAKPSNFYFEQLMDNGLDNEELFFHNGFKKAFRVKASNNDKKIQAGECVWGYTASLQQTSTGTLPVIFDSPTSTGDSPKFSRKVWKGKIIVARLDNSARVVKISGSDKTEGIIRERIDGEFTNIFAPENLEEGILTVPDLRRIGQN